MAVDFYAIGPGVNDAKFISSLVPGNFRRISRGVLAGNDSLTVNFDLLRPHCIIRETRESKDNSTTGRSYGASKRQLPTPNKRSKAGQFGFRKLLNWVGVRFVAERKARVRALWS